MSFADYLSIYASQVYHILRYMHANDQVIAYS